MPVVHQQVRLALAATGVFPGTDDVALHGSCGNALLHQPVAHQLLQPVAADPVAQVLPLFVGFAAGVAR